MVIFIGPTLAVFWVNDEVDSQGNKAINAIRATALVVLAVFLAGAHAVPVTLPVSVPEPATLLLERLAGGGPEAQSLASRQMLNRRKRVRIRRPSRDSNVFVFSSRLTDYRGDYRFG